MVQLLRQPLKLLLSRYEDVDDREYKLLAALVGQFWMCGEMLINNRTTDNAHWIVGEENFCFLKDLYILDHLKLVVALGNTFDEDGFVLILFGYSFEYAY